MKQSKFMDLGKRDLFNGLIMAVLSCISMILWDALSHWANSTSWSFEGLDWMLLIKTSLKASVIPYLGKNFFTKEPVEPLRDEETDWDYLIAECQTLDDLGDLEDMPYEFYDKWCARYTELGLGNNYPSYDEIRAGSVGTSGPKK